MVHKISRRSLMIGAATATLAGGGAWLAGRDRFAGQEMDPQAAFDAARDGAILLVDIRRPDEWMETGIPEGATPIDMRRADFIEALDALATGDRGRRIALICARGVRSDRMSARLTEAGFTRIADVPEGMLGSRAGPGWLMRGLPVMRP